LISDESGVIIEALTTTKLQATTSIIEALTTTKLQATTSITPSVIVDYEGSAAEDNFVEGSVSEGSALLS
jgi:hypothetical protein